eukprot:444315-Amphidinium_carterae.1
MKRYLLKCAQRQPSRTIRSTCVTSPRCIKAWLSPANIPLLAFARPWIVVRLCAALGIALCSKNSLPGADDLTKCADLSSRMDFDGLSKMDEL